MPTYDFVCLEGHAVSIMFSISQVPDSIPCSECDLTAERQLGSGSPPIFKGSGFYQKRLQEGPGAAYMSVPDGFPTTCRVCGDPVPAELKARGDDGPQFVTASPRHNIPENLSFCSETCFFVWEDA